MAFWFFLGSFRLILHGLIPNLDTEAGRDTVNHYKSPK